MGLELFDIPVSRFDCNNLTKKQLGMLSKMNLLYVASILASLHFVAGSNAEGNALYEMKKLLNANDNQLPGWHENQVTPCTWRYVKCNDNNNVVLEVTIPSLGFSGTLTPRIGELQHLTILSLQGNNITGGIPEEIGNLSSLTTLYLEDNRLSGDLPASLGKLTKLQKLSLDQNKLSGKIPESFSNLHALNDISLAYNDLSGQIPDNLFRVNKYNFTGNHLNCGTNFQNLCTSSLPDSGESHAVKLGPVLGGVLGSIVIVIFVVIFFLLKKKIVFRREDFFDVAGEGDWKITLGQLKRFTLRELQVATNNFSEKNVLGQGGFGKVYKGVLLDNTKIAIKRMSNFETTGGEAAFLREVEMISVAVHKNLLRLIGFCTTSTERLLVYPFMQNLSLAYCLRDIKAGKPVLDWPTRKQIALGTARGVEYLHQYCNPKIIHRDVKAANVLLDENFQAVVGDFGLAKLVDVRKTSVTTRVCGTMGHIAPEYLSTGKSSEKTDIFSYGILLLELVTGQRAIDFTSLEEEDEVLLLDLVKRLEREKRLDAIVDRNLGKIYNIQEMEMIIQVALLCTQASPEDRPTMSEVIRMLEGEGLADKWEEWQQSEVARRQEYDRMQQRVIWGEDSMFDQEAIELSGGR